MNLPTMDHTAHHSQQWVTLELGLDSTMQGIPSLGKVDREVLQLNKKEFLQGATYDYKS